MDGGSKSFSALASNELRQGRSSLELVENGVAQGADLGVREPDRRLIDHEIRRSVELAIEIGRQRVCTDLSDVQPEDAPLPLPVGMRDLELEPVRARVLGGVVSGVHTVHRLVDGVVSEDDGVSEHFELFLLGDDNILLSFHGGCVQR